MVPGGESLRPCTIHQRFGHRIALAVSDCTDRCIDTGLQQSLGVVNRQILRTAVRMVHQSRRLTSCPQCLFKCVEHELCSHRPGRSPTDNATDADVEHKGRVHEACPRRDIGEIRNPERARTLGDKRALDPIRRADGVWVAPRRPAAFTASHYASKPLGAHQSFDGCSEPPERPRPASRATPCEHRRPRGSHDGACGFVR